MSNVLFEDGDWRICRTGIRDLTAVYHHCQDTHNTNNWRWRISLAPNTLSRCSYCKEPIPNEIVGLWMLHEWKR